MRHQQELHELFVVSIATFHLLIRLDIELLAKKVSKCLVLFVLCVLGCPLVDPLFNLILTHVLLGVEC